MKVQCVDNRGGRMKKQIIVLEAAFCDWQRCLLASESQKHGWKISYREFCTPAAGER